jgi:hypothetical protein
VGKLKVVVGSKADKVILLLILVSSSIQVNNLTRLEAAGGVMARGGMVVAEGDRKVDKGG